MQAKDPAKGKILADFLNWMVTDGQKMTARFRMRRCRRTWRPR